MLGNWSLGDYGKAEQIRAFFAFLVDVLGLDPHRLYSTCFAGSPAHDLPRDEESAGIWQQVFAERGITAEVAHIGTEAAGEERGIAAAERIFFYDGNHNWWSRGGSLAGTPEGDPCGPSSEVFYDFGPEHHDPALGRAHPASASERFLEIGNQVFMTYRRSDVGFEPLAEPNVDFGGGLERIAAAVRHCPDVYGISVLSPLIDSLATRSGFAYFERPEEMRVIADHVRGAVFLAAEGVRPSNREQGYVLRRLLRRAVARGHRLGIEQDLFSPLITLVGDLYRDSHPHVAAAGEEVREVLWREERNFSATLRRGRRQLAKMPSPELSGADLFWLADTYGLPAEISLEEAAGLGMTVAPDWQQQYDVQRHAQQERSRSARGG